jgi:hypothetical protein
MKQFDDKLQGTENSGTGAQIDIYSLGFGFWQGYLHDFGQVASSL